jgi:hypothetical protein
MVNGQIRVTQVQECADASETDESDVDAIGVDDLNLSGSNMFCIGQQGVGPGEIDCAEEPAEPQLTSGMVAEAFARVPLPPSQLIVQPPNGRTLVNFETNFYTETEPFTRSVTLLGQQVELSITPTSFAWRFGDGKSRTTSSPGSAFPDLEITHSYLRKGRVTPSVDTTYTATYRVNGGPSQPVPGIVTIAGSAVPLRVVTARPQLVG